VRRPLDAHSAYRASLHRATRTRTISESDRRLATPLWRAHIAEYSRLTLGLPRHGTCEQMRQFCAAA
jgi:hypothetical protein